MAGRPDCDGVENCHLFEIGLKAIRTTGNSFPNVEVIPCLFDAVLGPLRVKKSIDFPLTFINLLFQLQMISGSTSSLVQQQ